MITDAELKARIQEKFPEIPIETIFNRKGYLSNAVPNCHPDRVHEAKGLCRPCYNASKYREDLEVSRARSRKNAWKNNKIEITLEEYSILFENQSGICAICGDPPEINKMLAVDHDHNTGKIRGLLCFSCNSQLLKSKHTVEILAKAIAYLEVHK